MVDVTALCPRVVVIDHGKLLYDGDLSSLVRRVNPDKLISLKLSRPVGRDDVARFGDIVEHTEAVAKLRVSSDKVRDVVSGVLAALPIADLTVEDPPLEDVMRQLFATKADETKVERAG
jgi:ABC-2 type transport system ATP-binding protein